MTRTDKIAGGLTAAARALAPHAVDAVRNPLIRNGFLAAVTAIAVMENRDAHKNYGFSKFMDHQKEWKIDFTAQYEKWKEQRDEHWARIDELNARHAAEIATLVAELTGTREDESNSWEYWSGIAEQRARTIDHLSEDLADARLPAAAVAALRDELARAHATIAEMSEHIERVDPLDREETADSLLVGVAEQLRRFGNLADQAVPGDLWDFEKARALVATALDSVSDARAALAEPVPF